MANLRILDEGADARAPGRARGAAHAGRQRAGRAARRGGARAAVRPHKPYAMPTAGYADDVKKLGVDDLTAFYRRFYAPNNAVLIVAGDTTAEAVRKLAEKYYGPIPSRRVEPRRRPARGRRRPAAARHARRCAGRRAALESRISWRRPIARAKPGMPMPCWCWPGCSAAARPAACRARWWSTRKIALSATAGYSAASLGLTSFEIAVHPARGRSVAEIESAVGDQMKRLLDGGVTRRRGRAGAEPAAGERDLFAGFAGERPAPLRRAARHRRQHRRARRLAAGASPRCGRTTSWPPRAMSGATTGAVTSLLTPAEGWQ